MCLVKLVIKEIIISAVNLAVIIRNRLTANVIYIYSFGANHDGPTNGCEPISGDRQHVMSPQLSSEAGPVIWSNCSRKDITRFLDRNWGTCLEDHPSEEHEFRYPELPPGAMYNVDHQCRLQYGPEAMHCAGMDEVKDK